MTDNPNTPLVKATATDSSFQPSTSTSSTFTSTSTSGISTSDEALGEGDQMKVELLSEALDVQKQERQLGEVQISKRVVEEKVMVPVTLRHEEVTMTRNKAQALPDSTSPITGQGETFKDETFTIILHEEVPVISKTTRVSEIVEVQKRVLTETKTITETVRHEEVNIDEGTTGRVTIEGDTSKNGL